MNHLLEKNNCTIRCENVPNCEGATAELETIRGSKCSLLDTSPQTFSNPFIGLWCVSSENPVALLGSSRPPFQHHLRRTDAAAAREKTIPNTRNGAQTSVVYTEAKPAKAAKHPPAMMVNAFSRSPNRASICRQSTPKTDNKHLCGRGC